MPKHVEEGWSFFNRAVREKAEGKPRQETAALKLVTPEPPPAPSKPALPASSPIQLQPAATAAPASSFVNSKLSSVPSRPYRPRHCQLSRRRPLQRPRARS